VENSDDVPTSCPIRSAAWQQAQFTYSKPPYNELVVPTITPW
jgi:hypothetical protein